MTLDEQFNLWYKDVYPTLKPVDTDMLRDKLVSELTFLSTMGAPEYTLWRKWSEINRRFQATPVSKSMGAFFGKQKSTTDPVIAQIKSNLWMPNDPQDYLKLKPVVVPCRGDKGLTNKWNLLRTFTSTMINNSNIGRNLYFLVVDEPTGKYLGVLQVTGDFLALTPRDQMIGWTEAQKQGGMLGHTCIGSSIVPTQPLGYSYTGGKMLALLTISDVVENAWNEAYKDKLVGVTTTSLYGSFSQYDRLPYWKKLGKSAGSVKYEPPRDTVYLIRDWLAYHHPREYWEWYEAVRENGQPLKRDHRQRSFSYAYRKMGIPSELYEAGHSRGIYFCKLFEKTPEYLRQEVGEENLGQKIDNRVESLVDIWKTKYAAKRVENLIRDGRFSYETLFYDDLIGISWEQCKDMYLKEVGR